jgi:putative Holliday junction resolvase
MPFGRRLGIDYGDARVGIAICDVDGLVATPLTTLNNDHKLFSRLENLIEEHQIMGIYLGKPMHLNGVEGSTQESVAAFSQRLQESIAIPITYVDERMTTSFAERKLREMNKNARESKGLLDQLAAQAILQLGLEIEHNAKK